MHPSNPLRQLVHDIGGPTASGAQTAASPTGPITPSIVSNIPVAAPNQATTANEDDELDQIMRDVGDDLKHDDKKPDKKHFSLFKHKSKESPKAAQPPAVAKTAVPAAQPATTAIPAPPVQTVKASKVAKVPKAPKTNSAPTFVITMTVAVTAALIVAAWYAYK